MNAPVTRRALLGATAAVGAVALPAIAEAGITAAVADHPDAVLLRLLRAWDSARAAADLAGEQSDALWDHYINQEPARPEALTYRGDDGLNCGFEVEVLPNKRRGAFYGLAEIGRLMSQPLPSYRAWRGEPAPWGKGEEVGRWVQVPAERAIARRAEVLAAHHAWMAECRGVKDRVGLTAVEDAEIAASTALRDIEQAILGTVPVTAAGLTAKARWATADGVPPVFAPEWAQRVAADVVAMAERGGVAS